MTEPPVRGTPSGAVATIPEGLVAAVVELVGTGAVPLGAYTLAELTVVDAIVDFLETSPSDDVLAEAVRSLAARQLLVADPETSQLQVRGDLGITLAFQQRATVVLDARVTGTVEREPWRRLVLPQPEQIALEFAIDALGIHEVGLYTGEEAWTRLLDWLPTGDAVGDDDSTDLDAALSGASRSALVTVTHYTTHGSAESATNSTDVVLAAKDDSLHIFRRDPGSTAPARVRTDAAGLREFLTALMIAAA